MPAYAYTAINSAGEELAGELHARDTAGAQEQLRSRGLLALELNEGGAAEGKAGGALKRVKAKSLQVFSRQFATMIESGLNVVTALSILEEQTDDKNLAQVIQDVRTDVEGGLLLSEAMARHPRTFSRLYISMLEAGEAAGILDIVLDRVALQIEKEMQIKRRVKGAMIYPMLVMTFAFLVLVGMLLFLVPIFVKLFTDLGGQLPMLTRGVIFGSNILREYWFIVFPAMGISLFAFLRYKKTESGRRWWDRFRLRIPMGIGAVVLKVGMARFSRTLASLVASGVDIIQALEITGTTSGNSLIEDAVTEVKDRVQQGSSIAQPLMEHAVFPPMVGHMVRVGEETGELEKMLEKVADFYEDEVDASIQSLTSIIEPLLMIGVGLIVGIIVIAMYLPMFKILSLIK
ncbi:MAG: type II secretion system F family protein [Gaiellales bacterium]